MEKDPFVVLQWIKQAVLEKKGFNLWAVDVREFSSLTDFIFIAEGNVDRHLQAIAKSIIETLGKRGEKPFRVEGEKEGDWIVIDYLNIMVHLFVSELREKYQIEKIWQDAKIIDL